MKGILGIIGSGDLGQQIAHYALTDNHYNEVVFFDDFNKSDTVNGSKVLGSTDIIPKSFSEGLFDELIVGIGYKHLSIKESLYEKYKANIPFGSVIHSTCWVDKTAKIAAGVVVYPNCTVDAHVTIQPNTLLNINCTIAHDTRIGSHCFLSPRVAIAGYVDVKNKCILGINSTIIDNITISQSIQLGAGTVVINDINKEGLYVGNPARFIR